MNGSQILQGAAFTAVPLNWSIVGQRDFNGDGNADILWRDTAGDVGMWLMNGTQIIQGGAFGAVSTNWSIVGTGDFNGDGKADILWRDNPGNVGIWFMNGTHILQGAWSDSCRPTGPWSARIRMATFFCATQRPATSACG